MSISALLLSEKVFPAVCVLLGTCLGSIVSLVTPLVSWSVERRKLQHQARKEVIERWRKMVTRVSKHLESGDFGELFLALYDDTDFLSLEPHIGAGTQSLLDEGSADSHEVFSSLLADIASMEKDWKIL